MSGTSRRPVRTEQNDYGYLPLVAILSVIGIVCVVAGAAHLGDRLDDEDHDLPANPFALVVQVLAGDTTWPAAATYVLVAMVVVLVALGAGIWVLWQRRGGRRHRVDRAASLMAGSRDLRAITHRGASATAQRFGVASPGLLLGRSVNGGQLLYQGWEDTSVDIWGPRAGKTTSRVVPAILDAPGAVVATSNKRDLLDATRDLRAQVGAVWVFDPQGVADEPPTWWWDPLSYVTDETKAQNLADAFGMVNRDPRASTDAFFEPAGKNLLANLLLAAALDRRPITEVYVWLTRPLDDEAAVILREHGYDLAAAAVDGVITGPDKQRGGIYGSGQQVAQFLTNTQANQWVTPSADPRRPHFDPHAFVRSRGTLYSLSMEGRGSTAALVTAMTMAVTEAAEDLAKRSPGGRLPVPLTVVLDEAANVCRWAQLPNLYSHYGSRGICMLTLLQSPAQAVEVWGIQGWRKLRDAANYLVLGAGLRDAEFLEEVSRLIGDYDLRTVTTSRSRSGPSVSHSVRPERIYSVADLASMPRGRAVVLPSGMRPALLAPQPWLTGPYADAVRASIARHDPAADNTLYEHDTAMDQLHRAEATGHIDRWAAP